MSEPLLQFLFLGILVFSLYFVMDRSPPAAGKHLIEIGDGQLAQMFDTFSKTWQRPPTEVEFKGLVDGYVKEEIFYREGQKMGLEQDDTVVRRRIQQKMEFLLEPGVEQLTPVPGELEAYFDAHADEYRLPPQLAFRQVFFRSDRPGDQGESVANHALILLKADPTSDVSTMGEPTLLPERTDLAAPETIATIFDGRFAKELQSVPIGQWFGPIRSQYGVHLVFVEKAVPSHAPLLEDVRSAVQLDWETARRREIADGRYSEMKKQYDVKIAWPAGLGAPPIETSGVK
ncbi:peptidylprolyl isomerase [Rhizobium sp. CCGE 510]|uniref:peptidylprolyl isomerase n=1 Tax=Rhizobium sp. CCGE 510 TaxID=1132836 RepID=UPI001F0A0D61|nr:peptidylprolyl isomerase [Rhizobium sp. CCGE 510]